MYQLSDSTALLRGHRRLLSRAPAAPRVSRTVVLLGLTSLITDVSAEMVVAVLPLYLVAVGGFTPLAFGLIDGLYQGATALIGLASGFLSDRRRRHKDVAATGYALSALCKLLLATAATGVSAIGAIVLLDRVGKGIRTAPRDALISLATPRAELGAAFGVHRALHTLRAAAGLLRISIPRYRALLLCGGALSLATAGDAFVFLALQDELDLGTSLFPLLFVGSSVTFMLLAVPAGRIADRIGRARVLFAGYALLVAVYAALLLPLAGWVALVTILALLGAHYAATDGVLMALGSAIVPDEVRGSGLALLGTAASLARLAASVLFGALWTVWGIHTAIAAFGFALVAAMALAALLLVRTREPAHT